MIDYTKILTKEEMENIGVEKLDRVKKCSKEIHDRLAYLHDYKCINSYVPSFLRQIPEFLGEDEKVKNLIEANCIINDSKLLISILLANGYNYKKLSILVNKLETMRESQLGCLEGQLNNEDLGKYFRHMDYICQLININYLYQKDNAIVSRLVQLVTYESDLYLEIEENRTITKTFQKRK